VLDNARNHHGIDQEKLDGWMINHRLLLMHLPPYSPELNPIEIVWKQAKYHWRRFVTGRKNSCLKRYISSCKKPAQPIKSVLRDYLIFAVT
jgi:transposase